MKGGSPRRAHGSGWNRSSQRTRRAEVALLGALLASCGPGAPASNLRASLSFDPSPPMEGPTRVEVHLTDGAGSAVDARLERVEANMSHPGMVPEFGAITTLDPGRSLVEFEFSMGGDWFLVLDFVLPGGERVQLTEQVSGVESR